MGERGRAERTGHIGLFYPGGHGVREEFAIHSNEGGIGDANG